MTTALRTLPPPTCAVVTSPVGAIAVSVDEHGRITRLGYTDQAPTARLGHDAHVVTALDAYFGGELDALDRVRTAAAGTDFQHRVWNALCRIPIGSTASYTDIAANVGHPRAVRAVGRANATNPIAIVVPCHRVVRSDGTLGGYGGGRDRKRWLLRHEGALGAELADVG